MIDAFRLERIEQQACDIAANEATRVCVIVDAGEDQPEDAQDQRVLQADLRRPGAAS